MHDTALAEPVETAASPRTRLIRRSALLLLIVGAIAWVAFAYGFAPHVIRGAYDGHGPAFIAKRMGDKANWPVGHYLAKWYGIAGAFLTLWITGFALPLLTTSRGFARKYVPKATPGTLGALRLFVCCLCLYFAWNSKLLNAPDLINKAGQKFIPMGVMDTFYRLGLAKVVASYDGAWLLQNVTILALVLAAVGLFTRVTVPLAALLYVATIGVNRSFFWLSHAGLVPCYLLFALAFMRSGDGFSLDRMIRIWRQKPVPDADVAERYYGWCRWTLWLIVAMGYLLAGLSKLGNSGFLWWESTNMQALIYRNAMNASRGEPNWFLSSGLLPDWTYGVMGLVSLAAEVGFFAVLFSKRMRLILPILIAGMHYGIIVVMNIPFWDLIWIQAIFYDWRKVREWIAARIARSRPQWTLLYDGYCPLCRRTVGLISGIDLFERVRFQSFRDTDFDAFNAEHNVSVTRKRADEEMLLVRDGAVHGGFDAYRQMSLMLPLMWLVAPLMWLPGPAHVGRAIYAWVARNRLSFFQCTDACQFTPGILPMREPEPPTRRFPGFVAVAGVLPVVVLALFINRVEWYPVTCFQMFSQGDDVYTDKSVILMHHLYLVRPDGTEERAFLDKLGFGSKQYWAKVTAAFKFKKDRSEMEQLLRKLGADWNARQASDATRIAKFEMREHEWDFRDHSVKPADAPLRRTIVVDVPRG